MVLPVFPVPVPLGLLLGDAPMLPELPFSLPLLQVSETISTLATLKVFSDPDAYFVVLGQQLEQLEPGEIEVVPLAAADEISVDPAQWSPPATG